MLSLHLVLQLGSILMNLKKIALIEGDGIGPEISRSVVELISSLVPHLEWIRLNHEDAYTDRAGHFWDCLNSCDAILKGPTTTTQGSGRRSLNVAIRTSLGLFANVRPVRSFAPFIPCARPVDMVIIRENEEDLYVGLEYQQSPQQAHALKIGTNYASRRLSLYALEFARHQSRNKITCMTKDNIMKITDGMFAQNFRTACLEYPEIKANHKIIDIGAALVATRPEEFEIIVTTNLYGDIISDIAAQVAGSVGLAGSANVGESSAMFEAIHGSAPDIAGLGLANPSGLISASVMMLSYLGCVEEADLLENAWLKTLEEGVATKDICPPDKAPVTTEEFVSAIKGRIGSSPLSLRRSPPFPQIKIPAQVTEQDEHLDLDLVGVDIFIRHSQSSGGRKEALILSGQAPNFGLSLESVFNRGVKIVPYPENMSWMSDQWRHRFMTDQPPSISAKNLWAFVSQVSNLGFKITRVETLCAGPRGPMFSE